MSKYIKKGNILYPSFKLKKKNLIISIATCILATMLLFLLLFPVLLYFTKKSDAKELIKIGVVDTGLDITDARLKDVLCPTGHRDFTGTGLVDNNGHGTHVTGLIKQHAGNTGYCLIIYKYYDTSNTSLGGTYTTRLAFQAAIDAGVKYINYSSGGTIADPKEKSIMTEAKDVTFVVGAGNNNKDINDPNESNYPSAYNLSNIISVGSLDSKGLKSQSSNYGNKVVFEIGEGLYSTYPNNKYAYASGTSMACAVHTGKLIKKALSK